jgi:hypothetical protein
MLSVFLIARSLQEKGSLYLASGEMLKVGSQKVFLVLWHLAMSNFICFNSFFILDLTKSHHFQFRSMNNSCYSIATGNDSVNNAFSNSQIFSQLELIVEGLDENLRTDDEVEKKISKLRDLQRGKLRKLAWRTKLIMIQPELWLFLSI